jgi:hypothetical protein
MVICSCPGLACVNWQALGVYTEFLTHADNICFAVQAQLWQVRPPSHHNFCFIVASRHPSINADLA